MPGAEAVTGPFGAMEPGRIVTYRVTQWATGVPPGWLARVRAVGALTLKSCDPCVTGALL